MRYWPGKRFTNVNSPSLPLVCVRFSEVPRFVRVTFASGTEAPELVESAESAGFGEEAGEVEGPEGLEEQMEEVAVASGPAVREPGRVAIGGGARGTNVHIATDDLVDVLGADVVDVTKPG